MRNIKGYYHLKLCMHKNGAIKNDVYADFMWKTGEVYDIQKSEDKFVQNS